MISEELMIVFGAIGVAVALVLAGVGRLKRKLSETAQPTLMTYVNELGGYIVFALLAVILAVVAAFVD